MRPRSAPRRRAGRLRRALALGGVALAALAALSAVLVSVRGDDEATPAPAAQSRLLSLGTASATVHHSEALNALPAALAAGSDGIWLASASSHDVLRIDAATGTVADRIQLEGQPVSVAVGRRAVWVASTLTGTLSRIAGETGEVTQTLHLGGADASAVAFGGAGLWVADATDRAVLQIDEDTGEVLRTVTLDGRPAALAVASRSVWVADHESGRVTEIDGPSGKTLAAVDVGGGPVALAVTRDAVWVANSLDATVSRIDPATGKVVATVAVGSGPSGIAVAGESVWVTNQYAGTLTRIDARSNRVAATIRTRGQPTSVAAREATVWVGAGAAATTHRGGTLVLASTNRFASIDPAFQNLRRAEPVRQTGVRHARHLSGHAGPSGLRLVPGPGPRAAATGERRHELRVSPPTRHQILDGRLLRASDFRRAIERLFRCRLPGRRLLLGPRRQRRLRTCAEGLQPRSRNQDGRRRRHRRVPPDSARSGLPLQADAVLLRCPDPPGSTRARRGLLAGPRHRAVSPLAVARRADHVPAQRVLPRVVARRTAGRQSRRHRVALLPSFEAEARAIRAGTADWIFGILSPEPAATAPPRIACATARQPVVHRRFHPAQHAARPFDDVRVRQALNLAIDRGRIVEMYGGPSAATPTCQPLPAGLLGFRRNCPYTAAPQADGVWNAPDLARARRLVTSSGTSGQTIDVWGANDELGVPRELPAYVASVLRTLGYRTHLHTVPIASISYAQRRGFQLSVDGDWSPDYPSASALLPPFFGCRGGYSNGYVCDHELERKMQNASSAQLRDPAEAARLWAEADRMIVERAYWVPTVISHPAALVSKRLRNYQYNPTWDFVADQAWVR